MTTMRKNISEHKNAVGQHEQNQRISSLALQARRLLLYFLEMQIPMGLGALVCFLFVRLIPASSSFAGIYHPGTYLFASGDILFLSAPVVVWMVWRGHGWRLSVEIATSMLMPVEVIILLAWLSTTASAYLLWLITAGYPAMCLGMLVYMLYRREYFIKWSARQANPTPLLLGGRRHGFCS